MLKLYKDNQLARSQLAKKAKKKIPLYENRNALIVKVPFLDVSTNKTRYFKFANISGMRPGPWSFIEVVD